VSIIQVLEYSSWLELKRDLFVELFGKSAFRPGRYLFRGMGNADWKLSSSFDRRFSSLGRDLRLRLWEELIKEWRRSCEETGVPDSVVHNDQKLWALGQHHGLSTRLLDWTTREGGSEVRAAARYWPYAGRYWLSQTVQAALRPSACSS
jgi:FRG domain